MSAYNETENRRLREAIGQRLFAVVDSIDSIDDCVELTIAISSTCGERDDVERERDGYLLKRTRKWELEIVDGSLRLSTFSDVTSRIEDAGDVSF
jgi:hypothetical protein